MDKVQYKNVIDICKALIDIVNTEGTTYGHDLEVSIAERLIEGKKGGNYDKGTNKGIL